jgi:hypothetical protein
VARGRGQKSDQGGCGLALLLVVVVVAIGRCGAPAGSGVAENFSSSTSGIANATDRYVEADQLNCRREPRRNARRISGLTRGAFVIVEEIKGDWSRVHASGSSCWVQTRSLTETAPAPSPAPSYAAEPVTRSDGRATRSRGNGSGSGRTERRQSLREGPSFRCGGKRVCGQMDSCEEANFYLNQCGLGRLDGDNDGVPCESICG